MELEPQNHLLMLQEQSHQDLLVLLLTHYQILQQAPLLLIKYIQLLQVPIFQETLAS